MTQTISIFRVSAASAAILALASCGTEAPEPPAADAAPAPQSAEATPPPTPTPPPTETAVSDAAETVETAATETMDIASTGDEMAESHDSDHGGHEHDDHGDHDHEHDDHDESHEHSDGHDHGDESHEHASGEAHVHGEAEGAIILEGETLTVSIDSALASFGISEAPVETPEQEATRQAALDAFKDDAAVLTINGEAGCTLTETSQAVRTVGGAANATFDFTYTCADPGALSGVTFTLFETTSSMEELDLAIIKDGAQDAVTLTQSAYTASLAAN
ncbi:MAG: DUF2796 domain-containing protein [Pseudomonadota bacterium]